MNQPLFSFMIKAVYLCWNLKDKLGILNIEHTDMLTIGPVSGIGLILKQAPACFRMAGYGHAQTCP